MSLENPQPQTGLLSAAFPVHAGLGEAESKARLVSIGVSEKSKPLAPILPARVSTYHSQAHRDYMLPSF